MHKTAWILALLTSFVVVSVLSWGGTASAQSPGTVLQQRKISSLEGEFFGGVEDEDRLGISVTSLGDLDGGGPSVEALAVGTASDDENGTNRGAVWILFLAVDGTVLSHQKINDVNGGFMGSLSDGDLFGTSVSSLGDIDGAGPLGCALAVGAPFDDDGGANSGAVWILFLDTTGNVESHQKLSATTGTLTGGRFGASLASLGDLDGANSSAHAVAVGATVDNDGGLNRGVLWIVFLSDTGTVSAQERIGSLAGDGDQFGRSVVSLGDIDGPGPNEHHVVAVGQFLDDGNGVDRGAVWILFLNTDGTLAMSMSQKIGDGSGNFLGVLDDSDNFGRGIGAPGDLNGDGIQDLAVGTYRDDDGGPDRGAVWILFLDADGTVLSHQKISSTQGGFTGPIDDDDRLGTSLTSVGDYDGNGAPDLAICAPHDDDGGFDRGAVWIVSLDFAGANQPPFAFCQDVVISASPGLCDADVFAEDVDGGSFDPDGDPIALQLNPSGPYPIGSTSVTLTVTDESGETNSCLATVTVNPALPIELLAAKDSFVRRGSKNRNEGANPRLRVRSSGKNRTLVGFDLSGVDLSCVTAATLVLNIAENANNWGSAGNRTVDAHPLNADFAEGNGQQAEVPGSQSTRGNGPGVTWHCATDDEIANQQTNCDPTWSGGDFGPATASAKLHINGQTGTVEWDVTADVLAGADGWLIKKTVEGQNGKVKYYSREGAAEAGDAHLGPQLVLEF